jgi:outer membrane protein insertion porin family
VFSKVVGWSVLAVALGASQPVSAQTGLIGEVRVEREGEVVTDPSLLSLVETTVGEPMSRTEVRDTIAHFVGLNVFEDVRVEEEPLPSGAVRLRYVLVPAHPVDRVRFEGSTGVPEGDLRRVILDQSGASPRATQAESARQTLLRALRDRGYPQATIAVGIEETHNPDRATMVFTVQSGPHATIGEIRITLADGGPNTTLVEQLDLTKGAPYDKAAVDRILQRWTDRMHARGYYEARASHGVLFPPDGAVVSVTLTQGPLVRVAFAGDPLSESDRDRLVPIQTEASADEDLLEDSARAIEAFLKQQGHRDARVDFERKPGDGEVVITFTVDRGPQYAVGAIRLTGNTSMPASEVRTWLRMREGQTFSEGALAQGLATVRAEYRVRGYAQVQAQARQIVEPPDRLDETQRKVDLEVQIVEGARTLVREVSFEGNTVLPVESLRELAALTPGRAFTEVDLATARDRIDLEYRNRGYDQIVVRSTVTLADNDTVADVRFSLVEGPQVLVDRVLIVGAVRTKPETIRREIVLQPGQPLGYSATVESRARLAALGLFRRVSIEEIAHGVEPRRDVLVRVEESPATVVGGGAGVQGAFRLLTDEAGNATERFEVVPRGFFEVGRRNLWGKNRAVNLFTRVTLRNGDVGLNADGTPAADGPNNGTGFNEYRVVGTFREPRVFGANASVLITGIVEQAIRSSFNFARKEVRAESGLQLSRRYSLSGRYSFERTDLFDERFTETDETLIDRVFPQVRLSTFSGSFIRDSRDDLVDTSRGMLITVTSDLAARAVGSEVGFVKTYVETFAFQRLPTTRRAVLAVAARVGVANGFPREVARTDDAGQPLTGPDGQPVVDVVDTLPVSKRFFAGGDTTVRGFALDRLGDAETISSSGFPTGGNGVIILNGEMRVGVAGPLQAVGFLDAGNVVARASELSLIKLRAAAGFGVRFRSPVGPIRLDLGFKLDRRELSPGRLERRSVWNISLGQAF